MYKQIEKKYDEFWSYMALLVNDQFRIFLYYFFLVGRTRNYKVT